MLKDYPAEVKGDKLDPMMRAAELFFPKSIVKHDFRKLKPWEKGELNAIERRIKDVRSALPKGRKYSSIRFLRALGVLIWVNENFLEPRSRLGGKSAALNLGIPYPYRPYDWNLFLNWAKFVVYRFPAILKASLKKIPGTPFHTMMS